MIEGFTRTVRERSSAAAGPPEVDDRKALLSGGWTLARDRLDQSKLHCRGAHYCAGVAGFMAGGFALTL
jgi:hypothetical protein